VLWEGGEKTTTRETRWNNDQYALAINQSRARVQLVNSLKRFPLLVIGQCETLSDKNFFISPPSFYLARTALADSLLLYIYIYI